MLTLNQVTLIGFLGRDPEVRRLPSGDVAATLSIATRQRVRAPEGGG